MAIQANHRYTHVPQLIFSNDDSWDKAKIDAELDAIVASKLAEAEAAEGLVASDRPVSPWSDPDDHPYNRYKSGDSRYDVKTISEYLRPGSKPTYVVLRRMSHAHWETVQAAIEREVPVYELLVDQEGQPVPGEDGKPKRERINTIGRTETFGLAIRFGLDSISDFGIKAHARGLTDDQLLDLREKITDHNYIMLGLACLQLMRSLDQVESFL
jgi:hypothetical protein